MIAIILTAVLLLSAVLAVASRRLLPAAIWLAGTSATLAIFFYWLGAPYVAVIELSVGAGLVTVLFIFSIGMAGDEAIGLPPVIPRALSWLLTGGVLLLLGVLVLPSAREAWFMVPLPEAQVTQAQVAQAQAPLQVMIWEERGLDALVQIVLIFCGVLGLLGLLAEIKAPLQQPAAAEVAARREHELAVLEEQVEEQVEQRERELA